MQMGRDRRESTVGNGRTPRATAASLSYPSQSQEPIRVSLSTIMTYPNSPKSSVFTISPLDTRENPNAHALGGVKMMYAAMFDSELLAITNCRVLSGKLHA